MPREQINTGTDERYVRRGSQGQFKESDDVGRSLTADRRRKAKTVAKKGEGDRGDQKKRGTAKNSPTAFKRKSASAKRSSTKSRAKR